MTGYLESLVSREHGGSNPVAPRLPSRYEPVRWPVRVAPEELEPLVEGPPPPSPVRSPVADTAHTAAPRVPATVTPLVAPDPLTTMPTSMPTSAPAAGLSFADGHGATLLMPPVRPQMLEPHPLLPELRPLPQEQGPQPFRRGTPPAEPESAPRGPDRATAVTLRPAPVPLPKPETGHRTDPVSGGPPPSPRARPTIHPIARIEPPSAQGRTRASNRRSSGPRAHLDETVVEVTIGRIEVRAVPEATRPTAPRAGSTGMSLEEYLRRRSGESR